jgi:hypothetical protein
MMGANPAGLANLIKTHAGAAPPAGSSSTGAGAGAGAGSSASAPAEPGVVSLSYSPMRSRAIPTSHLVTKDAPLIKTYDPIEPTGIPTPASPHRPTHLLERECRSWDQEHRREWRGEEGEQLFGERERSGAVDLFAGQFGFTEFDGRFFETEFDAGRLRTGNCDYNTFAGHDHQFNQPVKIKSISFFSGISPTQGPKTVQLFINQPQFDFADADSHEPTQELVLSEGDVKGGNRIDLRFVRFQNVNSLHVSFDASSTRRDVRAV